MKPVKKRKYKYVLDEDYIFKSDFSKLFKKTKELKFEYEYGIIYKDRIHFNKGYAWNGCSGNVWQGKRIDQEDWMPKLTLDSDKCTQTVPATLIHDFMYQYLKDIKKEAELHSLRVRKIADKKFYSLLKRTNFKYAKMYYFGVRIFGTTTYIKRWF